MLTFSYRAFVKQLVNSTNVVKSAEAYNGSKWLCVTKVQSSLRTEDSRMHSRFVVVWKIRTGI